MNLHGELLICPGTAPQAFMSTVCRLPHECRFPPSAQPRPVVQRRRLAAGHSAEARYATCLTHWFVFRPPRSSRSCCGRTTSHDWWVLHASTATCCGHAGSVVIIDRAHPNAPARQSRRSA